MWTEENRCRYERRGLRYPSDLTDREWALLEPLIPPAKRGGRKRSVDLREVVNGLLYILETGCPWRHLPKDLPPKSTVHGYFDHWSWDGTLDHIHDAFYVALRDQEGREASPTAAIIDSQSAKSGEKGASIDPVGYEKTKDIKRHVVTDHQILLLNVVVHPASFQDRDGVGQVLSKRTRRRSRSSRSSLPMLSRGFVFAMPPAAAAAGASRSSSAPIPRRGSR